MKATDLYNANKEEFETVESFAKRVYETAKRVTEGSMNLDYDKTTTVIRRLCNYYKEDWKDIKCAIGSLGSSQKYSIYFYNCLGELLLMVDRR